MTSARPWVLYHHVINRRVFSTTAPRDHSNSIQGDLLASITIATIASVNIIHVALCDVAAVYGTVVISSLSPGMTQSVNESDEGGRGFCTPCSL